MEKYKTKVFYKNFLSFNLYRNNLLYFDNYEDENYYLKKCTINDDFIDNYNLCLDKNKFTFAYKDILHLPYYNRSYSNSEPKILFFNKEFAIYIHSIKQNIKQIVKIKLFI